MSSQQASTVKEIIDLTTKMLAAIASGDFNAYAKFNADDSTCFEPEAAVLQIKGLSFHKYYFDLPAGESSPPTNQEVVSPEVRIIGDVAM
jgi:calcium/calmodulin-dependent protein kinase (CaM kinase) II